ncbi:tumor protein p53-inducible protein 11-like isoform X2 [Haliotis rubra]|uniref:tumor protein p53-inducible protein 11-like isoform X2 n=1 Tax=Haliotis rubra TaxID=36100 RepID=UPI001EE5F24C|nr:tumor protein p53-inducible protein 11-like isoform X2 [Haliotis rubra]
MSTHTLQDRSSQPSTAHTSTTNTTTSKMAPPAGVDEKKITTPTVDHSADISPAPPRRLPHLHKLEKKHSSGDLHSRLKTRKLLGVGETDDGDVHRSKLSQILGHSDQLYIRLPQGLRVWQCLLAAMFTIIALWALVFPAHLFDISFETEEGKYLTLPVRLYGAALLSLSCLHWNTLQSQDRDVIRGSLLSSVIYFSLQTLVSACSFPARESQPYIPIAMFCCRIVLIILSSYFYWMMGRDHWRSKDARYYR